MERETIDTFIDKFTQNITIKLIRTTRKITILFFFLSACLLLTVKSYMFTGVLFVLLIGEFVYFTIILKKNVVTIYSGVGVSLALLCCTALSFNAWLYSIQKINGFFDPILPIVILLIEVLCLISGFFYTRRCVKKGNVRKPKTTAIASVAFVVPGMLGYYLSRYISNETSVHIQNVFFTIVFVLGCSMVMFVLGMVHVALIYYIKKYNILDREISRS